MSMQITTNLDESEPRADAQRFEIYHVLRIVVGLLLLAAAGLKGYQLATSPTPDTYLLNTRWFLILAVEYELLLGLWLLSGWRRRDAWLIALLSFAAFACVTFYKALSGEASCGCFGFVEVNPWITLVLDLLIVAALFAWRPSNGSTTAGVKLSKRLGTALALAVILGGPVGYFMASYTPAALAEDGQVFGDNEFVVLEPETWVGKRFPLLNYIDIGDQLTTGKWIVVLYRHDCPHCVEELPKYEQLAHETVDCPDAPQIALIEMPPYAAKKDDHMPMNSPCLLGKLDNDKEWFVQTPVQIEVSNGRVTPNTS